MDGGPEDGWISVDEARRGNAYAHLREWNESTSWPSRAGGSR
jgi:hypothetical protein